MSGYYDGLKEGDPCPGCKTPVKWLVFSAYCINDCDRKPHVIDWEKTEPIYGAKTGQISFQHPKAPAQPGPLNRCSHLCTYVHNGFTWCTGCGKNLGAVPPTPATTSYSYSFAEVPDAGFLKRLKLDYSWCAADNPCFRSVCLKCSSFPSGSGG